MCGIFGYIGNRKAAPLLIEGIRNLEYRGYDSAGIAVLGANLKISSMKSVGKVAELEKKMNGGLAGTSGIAHTRWATHGGVTEKNAHPHFDCARHIWVVHNGIIENSDELRAKLKRKGHTFNSETDTEVVAHLLEDVRKKGMALEDAARAILPELRGTYGLVIIDSSDPEKLVAVRNFSPLVLGIGDGEFFVASDTAPLLQHTRKVVYLKEREIAVLVRSGYRIVNFLDKELARKPQQIDWSVEEAKKGKFPHFMLKEIFDEPEAIRNSIRGRIDLAGKTAKLGGLAGVERELARAKKIFIVGCGTAYHAGRIGEYLIEELAGVPVETDLASEFRYRDQKFGRGDVVLAISQSGETADTLAAVKEAKRRKALTLGVTNVIGSTLSRETHAGIYQHIGPEIGVAATKTFVSQVGVMALLAVYLGRQRDLSGMQALKVLQALQSVPDHMQHILKDSVKIKAIADRYKNYKDFIFLGRKYNFPTALEGALKLKEISYVHAEGLASGELKHGTLALIDKNVPTICIMPTDSVYEKNFSNIREVKARSGPVIAIATEGDTSVKGVADHVIFIPEIHESLSPLLATLPLQLFAYYFAAGKGLDVDKPRNLAKSVTVE